VQFLFFKNYNIVKTGNDAHTMKSRARMILFSKRTGAFYIGKNKLVDFLLVQYPDFMPFWHHRKTGTTKRISLNCLRDKMHANK
jgi:hypothetical protein